MPANPVVILTQEEPDNARLAALLDQRGLDSVSYPCISTSYIPVEHEQSIDGYRLGEFSILAFTSRRGVIGLESVAPLLQESRPQIACVGESTASEVKARLGLDCDLLPRGENTAGNLASEIAGHWTDPQPLLHVRGTRTTGTLRSGLELHSWQVSELIVYRSESPAIEPITGKPPRAAVFASPSAAKCFFSVNTELIASLPCIAIGSVTENALRKLGAGRIMVSACPDQRSVADAVEKLTQEESSNGT